MRLWYLALLGLLCGISIANAQDEAESDHSPTEENLSSSIEKQPIAEAVQGQEQTEKESSITDGLNSEEVHREFEEYPEHSEEQADQKDEKPSDEPANATENVEPARESEEEPKNEESSHEIEEQPEIEDHDDEEIENSEGVEEEPEKEDSTSEAAPEPESITQESPEEKEEFEDEPELEDDNDLEVPPEWENEEEIEDVEELDDTSSEGAETEVEEVKSEEPTQSGGENDPANVEEGAASLAEPVVEGEVKESSNSNNADDPLPEDPINAIETPSGEFKDDDVTKTVENVPDQATGPSSTEQKEEVPASETETPKEEEKETSAEVQEKPLTTAEIRAAIIALAQKAYRKVIQKEDQNDEAEELRAEPKLDTSEETQINQLLTKDVDEKEEAAIEKAEKVEEESIINEIKEHEKQVRLRRQARENEDPTEQPAGASPVELPMETKDTTGKNETLPAEIKNDVPIAETVKQDLKKVKFTDGFGWIHYPWKKIPISKKRYHYNKQCGCQVMWIKKVYTRPRPKSKLLLVQSSYINLRKPCHRTGHKHHHHKHHHKYSMKRVMKHVRRRPTSCLRGKKLSVHKFPHHSSTKSLAEKSWHSHLHKKKRAVREGKKAFVKRFRVKGKKHFKPLH